MDNLNHMERLLNLLNMIQKSPGIKAKELAKVFGRSIRTIQRDISSLRKAGFNIASSNGAAGGYIVRGSYYLKPLLFTGAEALAIFVASQVLLEQKGTPYKKDLESALAKIYEAIFEKDRHFFQSLEPRTSIIVQQIKDYYPWGEIFSQINQAILDQVSVEIIYDSYSSRTMLTRKVNPYHLLFREGCWYLIAHCHFARKFAFFVLTGSSV
jgi:predicted DNA-binding transcriptional regulator YafY